MKFIEEIISDFASFIWGLPLLILLIGGGIYLLIRSQFLPFRFFGHAIQVLRGKYDDPNDPGQISHFQALTTALSALLEWEIFQVLLWQLPWVDLELFFGCGSVQLSGCRPSFSPLP